MTMENAVGKPFLIEALIKFFYFEAFGLRSDSMIVFLLALQVVKTLLFLTLVVREMQSRQMDGRQIAQV